MCPSSPSSLKSRRPIAPARPPAKTVELTLPDSARPLSVCSGPDRPTRNTRNPLLTPTSTSSRIHDRRVWTLGRQTEGTDRAQDRSTRSPARTKPTLTTSQLTAAGSVSTSESASAYLVLTMYRPGRSRRPALLVLTSSRCHLRFGPFLCVRLVRSHIPPHLRAHASRLSSHSLLHARLVPYTLRHPLRRSLNKSRPPRKRSRPRRSTRSPRHSLCTPHPRGGRDRVPARWRGTLASNLEEGEREDGQKRSDRGSLRRRAHSWLPADPLGSSFMLNRSRTSNPRRPLGRSAMGPPHHNRRPPLWLPRHRKPSSTTSSHSFPFPPSRLCPIRHHRIPRGTRAQPGLRPSLRTDRSPHSAPGGRSTSSSRQRHSTRPISSESELTPLKEGQRLVRASGRTRSPGAGRIECASGTLDRTRRHEESRRG